MWDFVVAALLSAIARVGCRLAVHAHHVGLTLPGDAQDRPLHEQGRSDGRGTPSSRRPHTDVPHVIKEMAEEQSQPYRHTFVFDT